MSWKKGTFRLNDVLKHVNTARSISSSWLRDSECTHSISPLLMRDRISLIVAVVVGNPNRSCAAVSPCSHRWHYFKVPSGITFRFVPNSNSPGRLDYNVSRDPRHFLCCIYGFRNPLKLPHQIPVQLGDVTSGWNWTLHAPTSASDCHTISARELSLKYVCLYQ